MALFARWAVMAAGTLLVALAIGGATIIPTGPAAGLSPIQVALDIDAGGSFPEVAAVLDRRRAAEVARRTTACMSAAGFDYLARPDPPPNIPDAGLDPVTWAARWGFGISTSIGVESRVDPEADRPVVSDALRDALYGDADRPGCHERARAEVYGLRDRLLATLDAPLAALRAAIDADPAMAGVLGRWQRCASTAIDASDQAEVDRQTLGEVVLADFARRAAAARDAGGLELLQAEERRVATGLAVCELAYGEARARVARPHEVAFVAAFGPALATAGAAVRAAESAYPADPGS